MLGSSASCCSPLLLVCHPLNRETLRPRVSSSPLLRIHIKLLPSSHCCHYINHSLPFHLFISRTSLNHKRNAQFHLQSISWSSTVKLSSTRSLTRPSASFSQAPQMESPQRPSSIEISKAPARDVGFRPQNSGIVKVQPPKREDLQPSYAQTLVFESEQAHGWYSGMSAYTPETLQAPNLI
jgi:hypothetical protein